MPIRVLAPGVISKIAAGEVVERPASVVKELIENAIDAGASQITVEARGGGTDLIRVTDNGTGIPASDVELALQRHATSKIDRVDDLDSISSLGFRGEALPSIAAVADIELLTSIQDAASGTFVRTADSAVVETGKRARPPGTTVTVRHLFQNVPARLKFLKSPATESGHISYLVSQYCLAYPEVRFSLLLDGRMSIQTTGSGELRDALVIVYGARTAGAMLQVGDRESMFYGFVSQPDVSRSNRNYLSFFVNRRWVRSRLLNRAVMDAYHGILMTGKYPVVILNITISQQDIDVNVHPAKTEIRFRDEQSVFIGVQRAIRSVLSSEMTVPEVHRRTHAVGAVPAKPQGQPSMVQERLFEPAFEVDRREKHTGLPIAGDRLPILRVLGQLAATYIIAEGSDGLYLIDQHAAHERILFERIYAQRQGRGMELQGMLEPLSIEVSAAQDEVLRTQGDLLASFGFVLEEFGTRTYLVRTVPAVLRGSDIAQALFEILDGLGQERDPAQRENGISISLACHGAVRAGQVLKPEEVGQLVQQLENAQMPFTCPHGRPTMIRFSSSQLEREFGRSL